MNMKMLCLVMACMKKKPLLFFLYLCVLLLSVSTLGKGGWGERRIREKSPSCRCTEGYSTPVYDIY